MAIKNTSRFFTIRRSHGGYLLCLRGRQVASIYKDGDTFWAMCRYEPERIDFRLSPRRTTGPGKMRLTPKYPLTYELNRPI